MTPSSLRIRRATVDDRAALKTIWASMRLPADELEKRLTEFQVVENAEDEVVGALGFQILRQHALLHNEGYSDFGVADAARAIVLGTHPETGRQSRCLPRLDPGTLAVLEKFWLSTAGRRSPRPAAGRMEK